MQNTAWQKIASFKPKIRRNIDIHRQIYRNEVWYVLQDHITGQIFRFSPTAYRLICLMDGKRTVQTLWENFSADIDDTLTQVDVIQLISQLHTADVLTGDISPDIVKLFIHSTKQQQTGLKKILRSSPLFLRFPLADPEKFLNRTLGVVTFFFTLPGCLLLLFLIIAGLTQGVLHWEELSVNIVDRVLSRENLAILWFVYPLMKGLHELGHAYAVKKWGGEVHQIGIMLLVFMPIPYVDASSSAAFRNKWQRVAVGGAGIGVELVLTSLALFFWVLLEPGLARTITYNMILIGGLSTLVFNGNPLLRYDGYYILSDLLNIPNLAQRSLAYLGYLVNRYILCIKKARPPYSGRGERFWFVTFGVSSFLYRICVYSAIILFISGKFFFIGVLLGSLAIFNMFALPLSKKVYTLFTGPLYQENKVRTILIASSLLTTILLLLFTLPFPYLTQTEGVIWAPENSFVRLRANGTINRINAQPNSYVKKGAVLVTCSDPLLEANVRIIRAQLKEYELRYDAAYATDQMEAKIIHEEIVSIRERLARDEERLREMTLTSPSDGLFILPKAVDLVDRFLHQGDLIGYVLQDGGTTVRIVVPQSNVDLIRERTQHVALRTSTDIDTIYSGRIIREVPGAIDRLPSSILGAAGGGKIATDPLDTRGNKLFENMFQFDITLNNPMHNAFLGSRIFVGFDYGYEPLAFRSYRTLRQLFLKRFSS